MINLATLAKRIAQVQRRLDYEAHMIAARLDKLDKAAVVAFRNANLILDEQQRNMAVMEKTIQLMSASLEEVGELATAAEQSDSGTGQPAATAPEQSNDNTSEPLKPAQPGVDESQQDPGKIKDMIHKLTNFHLKTVKRGNAA